uniref:AAA+ ATPase domain-containing protein n=1 Tax=Timema bartmani TaxID=61472 RepID=A0A7R9HYL6_9NEOP|nr:unnamed protein product [Timema bartmani]
MLTFPDRLKPNNRTPNQDSSPDLPVISKPVQRESDALDHSATVVDNNGQLGTSEAGWGLNPDILVNGKPDYTRRERERKRERERLSHREAMCSEITFSTVKLAHQLREHDEKMATIRKRKLACLVAHYLNEEGYFDTAKAFSVEARNHSQYQVCDNICLETVLQEYETYFQVRFQKFPKIYKRVIDLSVVPDQQHPPSKTKVSIKNRSSNEETVKNDPTRNVPHTLPDGIKPAAKSSSYPALKQRSAVISSNDGLLPFGMTIIPLSEPRIHPSTSETDNNSIREGVTQCEFTTSLPGELMEFVNYISRETITESLNTRWEDVIGQDEAKRVLKEAVVYPVKYPELFSDKITPWKSILLYGPPGTGKTTLARVVATEGKTSFFNVSASSLVSKWRGESEKMVRALFEAAKRQAPSTIFLDELDALASRRGCPGEHEASRRLAAEILVQMDGLMTRSKDQVFLLAATNIPWELDVAILRRFEKKVHVSLPNEDECLKMIQKYLPPVMNVDPEVTSEVDYDYLVKYVAGYSGSDIKTACKEMIYKSMRHVFNILETGQNERTSYKIQFKTIKTADAIEVFETIKPSALHLSQKYQSWEEHQIMR